MNRSAVERHPGRPCVLILTVILSAILSTGAAAAMSESTPPPPVTAPKIHQVKAPPDSTHVNAWIIETERALILVDTLFTTSDFSLLRQKISSLRKPLSAVIITHPHPDHYNNLAQLLKEHPGAAAYADRKVIDAIRRDDPSLRNFWSAFYPRNYPDELALPTQTLSEGKPLELEGATLIPLTITGGESPVQTVIFIPQARALITGDLVMNGVHPSFFGADSSSWLKGLETVQTSFPDAVRILPGHGDEGGPGLIGRQREYLTRLRTEISKRIDPDNEETPLSISAFTAVSTIMVEQFPYSASYNIGKAIRTVTDELLATTPKRVTEPFMY